MVPDRRMWIRELMDYFKPLTLEEELKKTKTGEAAEVNKRRLSKAPKHQLEQRTEMINLYSGEKWGKMIWTNWLPGSVSAFLHTGCRPASSGHFLSDQSKKKENCLATIKPFFVSHLAGLCCKSAEKERKIFPTRINLEFCTFILQIWEVQKRWTLGFFPAACSLFATCVRGKNRKKFNPSLWHWQKSPVEN